MDIQVNYDYREDDMRALIDAEALARLVIEREGMPRETEVSINFVTNEAIHELNRQYRGVDRPTDGLSFECDGYEAEGDPALPEGMAFELGDIVIAPDVAQEQAPSYGLDFADETSLLIAHGLLHLCGYDHMQESEAELMEARERELLTEFWGRPFSRCAAERHDS